jgi:putative heme-binding domain-containing protein
MRANFPPNRLVLWIAVLILPAQPASAEDPARPAAQKRAAWTTSRFSGTPDPPPPYTIELAFPKLRFDRPVALTHPPGASRLFVAELTGKILSFPDEPQTDRAQLALDLAKARPDLSAVYGITFHPQYDENHYVFICYVLKNGSPDGTRVSRFRVTQADPPVIDSASEQVIITWLSGGHNGGCLEFGHDGYLYISTGDAADPSPPDPLDTGQNVGDLLSSILRIDVDQAGPGTAYRIPPDNPFAHLAGARPEVWAYGLRNPWKMSFDKTTGDLWVGDVGWELWELVYRVERGGNYGWSVMEGRQPIHPEGKRGPTPILPPTVDHPHSEAASVTGGYVYRGKRLPDLAGAYIYGDYQSGKVWGVRHDGHRVTWHAALADTGLRLVAFGEDRDGELYLVEHERSNQIYRLVPDPTPKPAGEFPRTLTQSGLFSSTKDLTPAPGVIPYAINAQAWADGARGERLLAIPGAGRIEVDKAGNGKLTEGSVLAKTMTLDFVVGDPSSRRRLETQVLHLEQGSWRPYSYIWNDDQTDATLADAAGSSRPLTVRDPRAPGGQRELAYRFAARSECVLCHNPWVEAQTTVFGRQSASPLAFTTAQLNRNGIGAGAAENQLLRLGRLGFFHQPLSPGSLPRLHDPYDEAADLSARARAYLQVNCAHCHQFNAGGAANIKLGSAVPLEQTETVGVRPTQGTFDITDARIIAPGEPDRSVLFYRLAKTGAGRMPRIGSQTVDEVALRLIGDWIAHIPANRSQAPPDPLPAAQSKALATLQAKDTTPASRTEAMDRLTGSTRGALALVRLIDHGAIPDPTLREVIALVKENPRVEIRDLFERFIPDRERVKRLGDTIDPETIIALKGDPERGRQWFFAESATQCKSCHRIAGAGTDLGPDLSAIGSKYNRRDLLRHLLEPSREIDPKYTTLLVSTKDGQLHVGLLVEKTAREVVLRDAQNHTIHIPAAEIEQQAPQGKSLMPDQLLRDLTGQQAADLLEFLGSLKGSGTSPDDAKKPQ